MLYIFLYSFCYMFEIQVMQLLQQLEIFVENYSFLLLNTLNPTIDTTVFVYHIVTLLSLYKSFLSCFSYK